MCGIVGQFNFGGPADRGVADRDRALVLEMNDAIAHRGPDDFGLWQSDDGRVVLGHRRLAIVDLSPAGHQPMSNEDGTVWITFNGEIYNHAELRQSLRLDDRHKFRSRSDTEVIIHLYEERQVGVVEAIDGMFAFGLWDASRRRLVLARDRMGKKPVYYVVVAGRLLFASEIKALLAHPDVARRLDPVALNEYLTFSNVPEPRTLFEGLQKKFGSSNVSEGDAFFLQEHCDRGVDCDVIAVTQEKPHQYWVYIRNAGPARPHRRLMRSWRCSDTTPDTQCDHSALTTNLGMVIEHFVGCHQHHETDKCEHLPQQ